MFNNIAVLIDADNISANKADWIFNKISELGTIGIKRIYGDFTKSHLLPWETPTLKYAIEKQHQTSYSTGKNSSDIALVIDAIDLWHTKNYDAFCIISSDSDFIRLTVRLRRNGVQVFGFGEDKTNTAFRQACSKFFNVSSITTPSNPPLSLP
ncbi:MAG: NYN domain-containing protein [Moraxella sp.]|uniref:NYN domain-containing protein n=1 Tax=Moraxella sp. TaxID=479 RepID=UPI0026DBA12D|nr:NYN domain-containing protein [Moraxella sp.]MDO4450600.1 NYN domain-containing protein [Moraxella sp.]